MQKLTIQQAMNLAGQMFAGGRTTDAENVYRQILQQDPNHADATHCLGVIEHQKGQPEQAIQLVRRAIGLAPRVAIYHQNLGDLLFTSGDIAGAETALNRAIELDPNLAIAVMKLGLIRESQDRLEEAATLYRRALSLAPNYAEAHCNLGDVLVKLQRQQEAIPHYDQAIRLNPNMVEAYANRGVALDNLGRIDDAIADSLHALKLNPNLVSTIVYVGRIYHSQSRFDDAKTYFERAAQLQPDSAEAHSGLAMIHVSAGQYEQAAEHCRLAIRSDPHLVDPYTNLALSLGYLGRYDESLAAYDTAAKVHPMSPTARANRALLLLLRGEFEEGLKEYELRWQMKEFQSGAPAFPWPRWDGSDPAGKTILLWHEQGLGDTLQFIRYAKFLAARGARVIAGVQEPLKRLLQGIEGADLVLGSNDAAPRCDFDIPMMSLPFALGTRLETIPADVPYIHPDPVLVEQWRQRILEHLSDAEKASFRVGICWRGGRKHKLDRDRSATLEHFLPLARVPGVKFFSLQLGDGAEQARTTGPKMNLIDLTSHITDFADTAALIANLDLVISVDTALVHLTGAMANPVWTLLPFVPDFRWMLDRENTPWYPTMRLFRQPGFRNWPAVFEYVASELAKFPKVIPRLDLADQSS